jgi:glycosyltransferase involved in cell wall biosynthesis
MMISVCIITYNHGKFIAQTLESIVNQETEFSFELVIGEDLSSDNTRLICENFAQKYPHKIKLLSSDRRYGMMNNFIRVLRECKGKYVAFCEGDDFWTDKTKLQKQVSFLEKNPEYAICCHDAIFRTNNRNRRNFQWDAPVDSDLTYLLRKGNYLITLSVVARNRENIVSFLQKFPEAPLGDYLFYVSSAQYGKIRFIKERMGVYRVHGGGSWSQLGLQNAFSKTIKVLDFLYDQLESNHQDDLKIQLLGMLEFMVLTSGPESIEKTPVVNDLMAKMNIPPFLKEYVKFSGVERTKSSYYSKNLPIAILVAALKEKIKNQIFA